MRGAISRQHAAAGAVGTLASGGDAERNAGGNRDFDEAGGSIGAGGALVYCEGEFIESPAFDVPGGCRDTTGAGDAFHAGFIYGMLRNEDLESCMKSGNAVAALKCRSLGGRAALPTGDELKEFLR